MTQGDAELPVTSSTEPEWAAAARECYRDVLEILQQAGIPCAVGGTFAIHKHTGIWRATKDLDLLLTPPDVAPALLELQRHGFQAHVTDPVWLAKARRGEYFVDLITGASNGNLIVDQSWMERAVPDEILGVPCCMLNAEEMIASKIFVVRRERFDGSDIVHLIRACGERLDWNRLLQLLDPHWEMLFWYLVLFAYVYPARVDTVPERIWGELTRRFEQHIRHPKKDDPFRGSLVDPNMFAIDVNEWGERNLHRECCEGHPWLLRVEEPDRSEE